VTVTLEPAAHSLAARLQEDTAFYAENFLKIVDKDENLVDFTPNAAQLELEAKLREQHEAGQPMRAIVLKARQVGISTWIQAKLMQRVMTRANHRAIVIAHDVETGGILFGMGQTMYAHLPDDEGETYTDLEGIPRPLRPPIGGHRRKRELEFSSPDRGAWVRGGSWPNSRLIVDTAKEFEAGRGSRYSSVHCSELAFWDDPAAKLSALKNACPKRHGTLLVIESTANGHNFFKEQWDLAAAGASGYVPFFWPWWRHEEYRLPFLNEGERAAFRPADTDQNRFAEEEAELIRRFGLDLEQLNWRRHTIVDECSGQLDIFHQEYPATPEEAFLGTGERVFDVLRVAELITHTETEVSPPLRGQLRALEREPREGRAGTIDIPASPSYVPTTDLELGVIPTWSFWLERSDDLEEHPSGLIVPERQCVIGVDVSGGQVESEGGEPAYHAIEVVDHLSGEQYAEYVSRIDPHLLTEEVYMAAILFRSALVAVERTGSWGLPIVRTLWFDFHYPVLYRQRRHGSTQEKQEHRLGWDTNARTKPTLIANMQALLGTETTGIKSRALAGELFTYVRDEQGKTFPEPGKFADRLMAWGIAQQVRTEIPAAPPEEEAGPVRMWTPRNPRTGYR